METWRDISGYEGLYQVSNLGRIKSFITKYGLRDHPIILKPSVSRCGYLLVSLSKNKIRTTYSVHRLVAIAFCENASNHKFVDHINGIKSDNSSDNLQWVSQSENEKRAHKLGLKNSKGSRHSQAILNEHSVKIIRETWLHFGRGSQPKIAKYFAVNHATISAIVTNKRWL